MFHQSGGCCDGSAPMCYPAGEFQVGAPRRPARHGRRRARSTSAATQYERWRHTRLTLDVVRGRRPGFSLEAARGRALPDPLRRLRASPEPRQGGVLAGHALSGMSCRGHLSTASRAARAAAACSPALRRPSRSREGVGEQRQPCAASPCGQAGESSEHDARRRSAGSISRRTKPAASRRFTYTVTVGLGITSAAASSAGYGCSSISASRNSSLISRPSAAISAASAGDHRHQQPVVEGPRSSRRRFSSCGLLRAD